MSSQEAFYAKLVEKALFLISEKLVAFLITTGKQPLLSLAVGANATPSLQGPVADDASKSSSTAVGKATNTSALLATSSEEMQKFYRHIRKIHKYLVKLEQGKPRDPNFSDCLQQLHGFIKERTDSETASTMTSNFSMFKNYSSALKQP